MIQLERLIQERAEYFYKMEAAHKLCITARQLGVDDLARKEEIAFKDYWCCWENLLIDITDLIISTSTNYL